jgi:ABC transporter fused permease/ATP-binding protein
VSRQPPVPEPTEAAGKKQKLNRASLLRLLSLARPERGTLAVGIVALFVGSSVNLLFPQALRFIIDEALGAKDERLIRNAALTMLAIAAVQAGAAALRFVLFSVVGERVVTRLRRDVYERLMAQEVGFFDERRTGELTNRLASDTTVIQSTVSANISMALRNGVVVLGGTGMLLYTSPVLTSLMLLVVPPVAVGAVMYGRRIRKLSRDVQDALAAANEVAEESLSGIRTVRAFTAEAREVERYGEAVSRSFDLARSRAKAGGLFMAVAAFCAAGAAVAVLWYGSHLVLQDKLTVGALSTFLIYSLQIAFSLGALADIWADLNRASGASERVFELVDRVPAIPSSGGQTPPSVQGEIRFEGVHFAYPSRKDVQVLTGIDLDIQPGEMVALVGPSGAGKSTIASLVQRLYDPDGGRVLLDGQDVRALDPLWLRRQVGTVAQEPILFSTTVAENIRYGRMDATDDEVEASARLANAHDFIRAFPDGYRTLVGERGVQLSGGQKQRVAIARALLKDPRILVLDEATSALDAESEHLVKEALDRLMKGRSTLVIAHRLSTVKDAHRVLVLEGGKVVQSGTHEKLLSADGLYRKLVERQFVAA